MLTKVQPLLAKYQIINYEPLNKGWSSDHKYILKAAEKTYLLRVSSIDKYESKEKQFKLLQKLEQLDIYCSKPIEFGKIDDEYCYMLLSWLDGIDGKVALKGMNEKEAYSLGVEAGLILKKLHSIALEIPKESWWDNYQLKAKRKVNNLLNCGYQIPWQEEVIRYYQDNLFLMADRPLRFSHGDYHLGNLIVHNNKIGVIDFDRNTIADPYDDLKPYCWNVMESEYFETGLVNGYFNNNIPEDFFKILKFYTSEALLSQLPWSVQFGEEEIATALDIAEKYMIWWDNFKLEVPTWYKGIIK